MHFSILLKAKWVSDITSLALSHKAQSPLGYDLRHGTALANEYLEYPWHCREQVFSCQYASVSWSVLGATSSSQRTNQLAGCCSVRDNPAQKRKKYRAWQGRYYYLVRPINTAQWRHRVGHAVGEKHSCASRYMRSYRWCSIWMDGNNWLQFPCLLEWPVISRYRVLSPLDRVWLADNIFANRFRHVTTHSYRAIDNNTGHNSQNCYATERFVSDWTVIRNRLCW